MLKKLIDLGAKVDVDDSIDRQPLAWAAMAGNCDAILSLVNAGSSVAHSDKDGMTALHCAASLGYSTCVQVRRQDLKTNWIGSMYYHYLCVPAEPDQLVWC